MSIASPIVPQALAGIAGGGQVNLLALQAGQVVTAELVALQGDGTAVLAIKGQLLQALLDMTWGNAAALVPGQVLSLKVTPNQASGQNFQGGLPILQVQGVATPATAGGASEARVPISAQAPAVGVPAPEAQAQAVLQAAIGTVAARQNSLAPLFANLAAALGRPLPEPLRRVAQQFLGLAVEPDDPDLPQALARAFDRSGLFLEARLARADSEPALAKDMKRILLDMQAILEELPEATPDMEDPEEAPPAAPPARPPLRESAPQGQLPAPAALDDFTPLPQVIATLKHDVAAALARIDLLQIASREDAVRPAGTSAPERHFVFELPLAMAAGTGMAQFHMVEEREAQDPVTGESARAWRVKFSIETPEEGPILSQISLRNGVINVFLSAERPETLSRFQQTLPDLVAALESAALVLGSVQCRPPAREAHAPPAGSLLNRST